MLNSKAYENFLDTPARSNRIRSLISTTRAQIGLARWDILTVLALLLILAAGYGLRAAGRNWDDFTHLHPDERFLTDVASRTGNSGLSFPADQPELAAICASRYPAPTPEALEGLSAQEQMTLINAAGQGGYFDAQCSNLNPNNIGFGLYVYGQFPLFVTRLTGEITAETKLESCLNAGSDDEFAQETCRSDRRLSPDTAYNGIHLIGRLVSSVADTLTILVVFLTGLKLFSRWTGLIAAGLYAFASFPIQQSHFWTVDSFTGLWVMLAIYAAVNVLDDDARRAGRFAPMAWLTAAFAAWVWELPRLESPSLWPLVVYGLALGLAGSWPSYTRFLAKKREAEQPDFAMERLFAWGGGWGLALLVLVLAAVGQIITLGGLIVAAVLGLIVTLFYLVGLDRLAGYGGTAPWLMAAFGLWTYDSLAHYATPSLVPLLLYLIVFTLGSVLASCLFTARSKTEIRLWVIMLGGLSLAWILLFSMAESVSIEGATAGFVLMLMLAVGVAFGYRDYIVFGLAFGAALASRVNIAPVVGVVILASLIRCLPLLDRHTSLTQRYNLSSRAMMGLIVAAFFTLLTFRILQPHAFLGLYMDGGILPNSQSIRLGIIPAGLNSGWLSDVGEAQRLVSGAADIPPNHQWASRIPYLFSWQNIVLYGLRPALGVAATLALIWALWTVIRGGKRWTRLSLLVAWVAVYFGWLGGNWVTSMRYFLPLYGSLTLLAAWLMLLWIQKWRGSWLGRGVVWGIVGVVIFTTAVSGLGMAKMYQSVLTRTGVSLWFQESVPGDLGVWIETDNGPVLQNIGTSIASSPVVVETLQTGDTAQIAIPIKEDVRLQTVVLHRATDPARDGGEEELLVRIRQSTGGIVPTTLAERTLSLDLNDSFSEFGSEYSIRFDDEDPIDLALLPSGTGALGEYTLEIQVVRGGPVALSRGVQDNILPISQYHVTVYAESLATRSPLQIGLTLDDTADTQAPVYTLYMPSQRGQVSFVARADGVIRQLEIPHLSDPLSDEGEETLSVEITGTQGELTNGQVTGDFRPEADGHNTFGPTVTIPLDPPMQVTEGESYIITLVANAPLQTLGHVVATEGPWDDPIPYKVCPLPAGTELNQDTPSGYTHYRCAGIELYNAHYYGLQLYLAAEDDDTKRKIMQEALDQTDYLTISSNRFYDTLSRIPTRWPMTLAYYDALFSGELGFELVLTWESYPRFGPFEWKDQVLPTDDLPDWMNEYEVEEAFTVYDHPTVYVFQKTEAYSPENTAEILSVSTRQYKEAFGGFMADTEPVNRNVITAPAASESPSNLMLSDSAQDWQRDGGTWSDLFNVDSWVNDDQRVTVAVWWLVMLLMGWLTFPLLFALFPALPDRGYAVGKLVGWVLVAWLAWVGGALHLGTWSREGLIGCIGLLGAVSLSFGWAHRRELRAFLRERKAHLVLLEALMLLLFAVFLYVRYRNPDLWHSSFGGEKPMDFAYFNAVLRSETFPPFDPWFAGGYINYYYWGFVLVAAPVKLLGVVPAVAYNLIIPTLFSLTGAGALALGYNLVAAANQAGRLRANPWLAGIVTLLLVAVLGNLDTPRVAMVEIAKAGGWVGPGAYDLTQQRANELLTEFRAENEREPNSEELADITARAEDASLGEQIRYTLTQWGDLFDGLFNALDKAQDGEKLYISSHRWYWASTRIIGELSGGRGHNAINEMPYFTFLYGDLHAHMMAIPLMLLAMLWLSAEVLGANQPHLKRGRAAAGGALFLGGLTVGLLRATNTWDWPTFMILGIGGLGFAAWLAQQRRVEVAELPRTAFYERLREYLDIREVWRLWPLLLALPVGFLIHLLRFLVGSVGYQRDLSANRIPLACRALDLELPIPTACEPYIKPVWHLSDSLLWTLGAFLLVCVAYVGLLILAGARLDRRSLLASVGRLAGFVAITFVVAIPFTHYYAGEAGLKAWEADKTPLWAYLDIHGLFIFILASFLASQTARVLKRFKVADLRGLSLPVVVVLAGIPTVILAAIILGSAIPVMLVTLPMLAWCAALFLIPGAEPSERVVYALTALALGLTTGVEIVVLDVDIGRQNMVFKFYMQAWLMFAVASGVALAWMLYSTIRWRPRLSMLWLCVLAVLFSAAGLYPLLATQGRWKDRFDETATGYTLDGQAYMNYAVYGDNLVWFNTRGDKRMIDWLNAEIEGTPTLIEAQTTEYKWGGRISINTGLPTVIGWNWHQRQQRSINSLNSLVWNRSNNVAAFYTTPSISTAMNLINFYGIEYIIVGVQERVSYNDLLQTPGTLETQSGLSAGIAKFDRMAELGLLEVVYESPSCIFNKPLDAEDEACPAENVVLDRVYRVVEGARYEEPVSQLGDTSWHDEG